MLHQPTYSNSRPGEQVLFLPPRHLLSYFVHVLVEQTCTSDLIISVQLSFSFIVVNYKYLYLYVTVFSAYV